MRVAVVPVFNPKECGSWNIFESFSHGIPECEVIVVIIITTVLHTAQYAITH